LKKIIFLCSFTIIFISTAPVQAKIKDTKRISLALYPGEKGIEFDFGIETGIYSDKTYTFAIAGIALGYNPWMDEIYTTFNIDLIQALSEWLALGVSGFMALKLNSIDDANPGLLGIADFILPYNFDIALLGGVIWLPDSKPATGIQIGWNF